MIAASEHFGNPLVEQRKLVEGSALVYLGERGIIQVSGVDRLDWLHSLLSQNIKNLTPGQSAEALLLDPNGHIEQAIHLIDDGQAAWLIVEADKREALLAWLNKMIFRMRVEVADRSSDFAVVASLGSAVPKVAEANGIGLVWSDPWPGVVSGGARYSMARPAKWPLTESLVAVDDLEFVLASADNAGLMALEALRVEAHRPRMSNEVDDRSLPHELDWLSTAVHLSKGCYRGQETVAKVHNLGHPPRRLTFLHLDGSGHDLPEVGDEVFVAGTDVARGKITTAGQHYEMGPIALALLSRSTPEDAQLVVRGNHGEIAATQEVIVPQSAGKAADLPKRNLLMGGRH